MGSQTKIGARSLSEDEIKLILPTYDKIFEQIAEIRNSSADSDTDMQKTNNIGIMGKRGAGKTSVLKTIAKKLKNKENIEENGDIVLDLIIPENMSEASTLMATILGLFKSNVDEIVGKEDKRNIGCGVNKENDLKRAYDEAIKQYAYIQKDYRDILIQEFSSESEYLKKTTQVFNSDIEFIKKLNNFIKLLIEKRKNEVKGDSGNPLIVVFIDDIDLSTTRCSDVVKTLLSYLSSPYILTFISGDLDTFEEALTLEFLRQEGFITSDAMKQEFLNEKNGSLLDRKKILAYEYLKKVLPPVYRHNIKLWSLEQRGKFNISIDGNNEGPSLRELLKKVLDRCENLKIGEKARLFDVVIYPDVAKEQKVFKTLMPLYSYHLFDNTSRGLNNVYNVLLQINEDQNIKDEKFDFSARKILIETIVSSNPMYNKNRIELFENIILFDSTQETTIIRWDNLKELIFNELEIEREQEHETERELANEEYIEYKLEQELELVRKRKNSSTYKIEKFSLFILIYFSAKLLGLTFENDPAYEYSKVAAIDILINNPIISENLSNIGKPFDLIKEFNNYVINLQVNDSINISKNNQTEKSISIENSFELITSFLIKSNFEFSLNFYQILSQYSFNFLDFADYDKNNRNKKNESTIKTNPVIRNQNVFSLYQAFCSYSENNTIKYIKEIYDGFGIEFSYLQSNIFKDKITFTIDELLCKYTFRQFSTPYRLLLNYLKENVEVFLIDDKVDKNYDISKFFSDDDVDSIKRSEIIKAIDNKKLWGNVMAHGVINYIDRNIESIIDVVLSSIKEAAPDVTINISCFLNNSWKKFKGEYMGASWTRAKEAKSDIREIIQDSLSGNNLKNNIEYNLFKNEITNDGRCDLISTISSLAYNNRVRYGQKAAQRMLNELLNTSTLTFSETSSTRNELNKLVVLIYYLMLHKYNSNTGVIGEMLIKFKQDIEKSQDAVDYEAKEEFIKEIIIDDKTIDLQEFNELFK